MAKIPTGMHSITPHLMVKDARAALALYEKAFGAEIVHVLEMPGSGIVMHASFKIGDSTLFISDEMPGGPRKAPSGNMSSVAFYLYTKDVDAAFARAKTAGLDAMSEPEDMFWGDRTAVLHDPFGHNWTLATQLRDVSPEEMAETMKNMAPA
ncbi:MAG: VOC family protein [Maricaulis sp.]|nr:VOC family protein [Maricaulis sp.]